jgi:hypothetical protein
MADAAVANIFGGFGSDNESAAIRAGRRGQGTPRAGACDGVCGAIKRRSHQRSPRRSNDVSSEAILVSRSETRVKCCSTVLMKYDGEFDSDRADGKKPRQTDQREPQRRVDRRCAPCRLRTAPPRAVRSRRLAPNANLALRALMGIKAERPCLSSKPSCAGACLLRKATQFGCFRLAHFNAPISGKPDIGVHLSGICASRASYHTTWTDDRE